MWKFTKNWLRQRRMILSSEVVLIICCVKLMSAAFTCTQIFFGKLFSEGFGIDGKTENVLYFYHRLMLLRFVGEKFRIKLNQPTWTSDAGIAKYLLK